MPKVGDASGPYKYTEEGVWVAFQAEVNEAAKRGAVVCPSCGNYSDDGIIDVYKEGRALYGSCADCGAHLAIIVDAERVEGSV